MTLDGGAYFGLRYRKAVRGGNRCSRGEWGFYQILMLECRVKEVFDDFEIFFLVVVVAIAEINNAEEIHNIGQVIYRQAFGRIVF